MLLYNLNIDGTSATRTLFSTVDQSNNCSYINLNIYNGITYGMAIYGYGNYVSNVKTFGNVYGIWLGTNDTIYENFSVYNNSNAGIYIPSTAYTDNIFNNGKIFNNGNVGLYAYRSANNTFNNLQIFNNATYGIYTQGYSSAYSINNIYNNITLFNNNSNGIRSFTYAYDTIYNNILAFNNSSAVSLGEHDGKYFGYFNSDTTISSPDVVAGT